MKFPLHLSPEQARDLQDEVISVELRVYLTRHLDHQFSAEGSQVPKVYRQNVLVNRARALLGLDQLVLSDDEQVIMEPFVQVWIDGEFQVALRRLDTPSLVDFIADLIIDEYLDIEEVNALLERDGASFRYEYHFGEISVEVFPIHRVEAELHEDKHPNIRVLIQRMDRALENEDYPAVLHASASIFETMAKHVVGIETIQDKTLGAFFERYRKDSLLPDEILDYVLDIYDARGRTPLSGHGSTKTPELSREAAIVLSEMTKAFVRIKYWLHQARTVQVGS